jgi:hypothetical protein
MPALQQNLLTALGAVKYRQPLQACFDERQQHRHWIADALALP